MVHLNVPVSLQNADPLGLRRLCSGRGASRSRLRGLEPAGRTANPHKEGGSAPSLCGLEQGRLCTDSSERRSHNSGTDTAALFAKFCQILGVNYPTSSSNLLVWPLFACEESVHPVRRNQPSVSYDAHAYSAQDQRAPAIRLWIICLGFLRL